MAKIRIYTRAFCGFCDRAVRLLEQRGIAFEEIDVTSDAEKRAWLRDATGQSTVPQIFVDDRPIGGCEDLERLDHAGELDSLLGS